MRFQIDLKIFIFALIFYFTKQIQIYALMMIFAMIHELGHLFTGILLGMKPEKFQIKPYGFSISFKLDTKDYNRKIGKANLLTLKKIIVALAGPLTNGIIILIAMNLEISILQEIMIVYINIILILFNILPVYPLDGGRVLKGLLCIKFGKRKALKYTNKISFYATVVITAIASISILYLKNIAIIIVVILVWVLFLSENRKFKVKEKIYRTIERNVM